jgi:hypothetical protein
METCQHDIETTGQRLPTKDSSFKEEKCVWIADIHLASPQTDRKYCWDRRSSMESDEERAFAAQIINQKNKEAINDESL